MKCVIGILLVAYTCIDAATLRGDTKEDANVTAIRNEYFNEKNVVYSGEHEIVKIYSPLALMYKTEKNILFFAQADRNNDGSKIDRGLYITVDKITKKLLDNGRDVDGDGIGNVYIAASDGVYIYDVEKNSANRYGTLEENLISIAAENSTEVIYALSQNHVLYKLTMNGTKADIEDRVQNAQEIAKDIHDDSVYYYDIDKNAYVLTRNGSIIKIQDLPKSSDFKMVKAPVLMDGMIFIIDCNTYVAYSNGTSKIVYSNSDKTFKPTAFSLEPGIVLYYSYDNKIYEFNIIAKIVTGIFESFGKWVKDKVESFLKS